MSEATTMRRLAAILAADVVGYSRMMGEDEVGTLVALRKIWSELFNPAVATHRGRIVKMMGDGALVEFGSAVDAVQCAAAIQSAMVERNSIDGGAKAMAFRIGVNLGDIVIDGDDIFGDGVNVAARLESQAPSGGVLLSDSVYAQIRGKVDLVFADAGEVALKNIEQPVRVWRWGGSAAGMPSPKPRAAVAQKPSIAVLPFTVMSSDPEQEFFADGLVEDILTTLSKLSGLDVIARNSSFAYKGKNLDMRQAGRELGARYVLEGSVRKAGNRIRITAQLVDAETGTHVWAERYDRALEDIFAVQDEITLVLATEMQVRLTEGEQARLRYTTTTNVEAWNFWIEGLRYVRGPVTGANQINARRAFEKALRLDPNSAPLNAMLGFSHFADARFGWWDDRETALQKSQSYVDRALAIDPECPDAHRTLAGILMLRLDFSGSVAAVKTAVQLGPNLPDVLTFASYVFAAAGRADEAVDCAKRAMTLSPYHPPNYFGILGNALRLAGRSDEALEAFRTYHERVPGFGLADIIMIEEQAGRLDDARRTAAELATTRPDFTVSSWERTQVREDVEQHAADLASLRRAGVRE